MNGLKRQRILDQQAVAWATDLVARVGGVEKTLETLLDMPVTADNGKRLTLRDILKTHEDLKV